MGTFTMTLLKILDITYNQNFASLGTSASHMANIVFSPLNGPISHKYSSLHSSGTSAQD